MGLKEDGLGGVVVLIDHQSCKIRWEETSQELPLSKSCTSTTQKELTEGRVDS